MRFTELVYDVIVEEIKNKSTIQFLYKKWLGDNPTDEQKESANKLISFFGEKRDSLSLKQPAVKAFLAKHSAESGDFFDPKFLKDVTKYTMQQMDSLRKEFVDDDMNNNEFIKNTINKWYNNQPTDDQRFQGYNMLTWFMRTRPKLSTELPEVQSFLYRFQDSFEPTNLKEISAYTLEQIEGLYYEFHDYSQQMGAKDEVFSESGGMSTEPKREASKKLWYGDDNVVVNEDGLKVHYIPDQRTAVKYGYYQQEVRNLMYGYDWNSSSITSHWCVTGRGTKDSWTNLWGRYRNQGKTFYFVIDESKNPMANEGLSQSVARYYLGALQNYNGRSWVLTSLLNDNDVEMTWEQVVNIYPQLAEHKEALPSVRYDEEVELNVDSSIIGRIDEKPGSAYNFSKQSPTNKKAYIDQGHPLTQAQSWELLNNYLRNLYIARTEEGNMYNSWQSMDLINAVKKTPTFYQLLKNKIEAICARSTNTEIKGKGISVIISKIIQNKFEIVRTSIDNPNFQLISSKQSDNEPSGIFNLEENDWLTIDGIQYVNEYWELYMKLYTEVESDQNILVLVYSKTSDIDPTSFFVLHPVTKQNDLGEAHFITYKHFQELTKRIIPKEENDDSELDYEKIQKFNPDTDVDIKEEDLY